MSLLEYSTLPFGASGGRWYTGTASPTSGNYNVGDIVFNSPAGAGPGLCAFWICTVASSGGTGAIFERSGGSTNMNTVTTTYAVVVDDGVILADTTAGAFTITLPSAVNLTGKMFRIKKIDTTTNAVTINTTSSQTIDSLTARNLVGRRDTLEVVSDGANWQRFARKTDPVKTVTVLYTATDNDETILADATSGAYTVTVSSASGNAGKKFTVKRISAAANLITVAAAGGATIEGSATYTGLSAQNKYVTIQSDGSNYWIVANN